MNEEKKPRRNWRFIGAVGVLLIMFVGVLLYTIVPSLLTYESLMMWSFVGWTANSEGLVRQATFTLLNNGTRTLKVTNLWANETSLNSGEWIGGFVLIPASSPSGTPGAMSRDVWVTPKTWVFSKGASYNFTVGTASGNHYSFILECDEASIRLENLTIMEGDFVPGPDMHITVHYRNSGERPFIVTEVYLDGVQYAATFTDYWTWPGGEDAIIIWYAWKPEETYTITIKTAVGNTYETTATAPS